MHNTTAKGITLPITAVVIMGIALIVVVAISAFFLSTGSFQISRAEAERIYRTKCLTYCDAFDTVKNHETAAQLSSDPEFLAACSAKGIAWKDDNGEIPGRCLEACPCDLSVAPGDAAYHTSCASGCLTAATAEEQAQCFSVCNGA